MAIVALKMRFRQKNFGTVGKLSVSTYKNNMAWHFGCKRSGFELWPADGGSVNSPFQNVVYIRIPTSKG